MKLYTRSAFNHPSRFESLMDGSSDVTYEIACVGQAWQCPLEQEAFLEVLEEFAPP